MKSFNAVKVAFKKWRDITAFEVRRVRMLLRRESNEAESDNPLEWHRKKARELGESTWTGD